MKPLIFSALLAFPIFSLSKAGAIPLSWSGSGRLEAFYQDQDNHYANFFFVFNPKLHLRDSLSFQARFDLVGLKSSSPWENLLRNSGLFHQKAYVFLYQDFNNSSESNFPFLLPTQFYLDYKSEFFKVRLGRAPYHFGLGTSYFATDSPFDLWISTPDQISVFMIYENFYLQPSVFYDSSSSQKTASALLQGGMEQEKWKVAILYEYKFQKEAQPLAELYGEYEEKNWNLKSSLTYFFRSENSFALALEGFYNWPTRIPLNVELKAGALNKTAQFHPQYNLSLLLQNRWMREASTKENYSIGSSQIQNSVYLAPSFSMSFFEESFKIQPLFLFAHSFKEKQSSYEWNLSGKYKPKESLFFNLQSGLLYQKEWLFALLAQAAVSF